MANDLPVILHKNGTATIELDGRRITLRMPKVGEFEQLRLSQHALGEQIIDANDRVVGRSHRIDSDIVELGGRDLSKPAGEQGDVNEYDLEPDTLERIRQLRREQRNLRGDLAAEISKMRLGWVREAIELLRMDGAELPGDDDLPQWLTSDGLAVQLITHWQTAPLARGGG